jgi:hypothetical protein
MAWAAPLSRTSSSGSECLSSVVGQNETRRYMDATDYEKFVQRLISELTSQHGCEVYHLREYVGKVSGRRIKIDVSFEFLIFGARILFLVECKHYNHNIEARDVEEFHSKLSDIGAHKGMVVTTVGFQDGAVKTAKGRGIALALLDPHTRPGELVMFANSRDEASMAPQIDYLLRGSLQDELITHGNRERFDSPGSLWSTLFSGLAPYIDDNGAHNLGG